MSRHRSWCFTVNNYTEEEWTRLCTFVEEDKCRYMCVGKEVAESGTPHLQGYLSFANAKSLKSVKKLLPTAHLEITRGQPDEAADYCKKDGDFFEAGERPVSQKRKGTAEKERWDLARQAAKEGRFEDIDSDIYMRTISACKRIRFDEILRQQQESLDELQNEWRHGMTGSGKSFGARKDYPDLFSKPLNKWWDGYGGQEVVLLEDVDPTHGKWLGYFLKIWGDHYPFQGEVKGGTMLVRPKKIIVTSQYTADKVFDDLETSEAIHRRYKHILIE